MLLKESYRTSRAQRAGDDHGAGAWTENPRVAGSIPALATISFARI
jgi:hypothetical protein